MNTIKVIPLIFIFTFFEVSCGLKTKYQSIQIKNLPKELNNFKIAHISDLHIKKKNNIHTELIQKIAEIEPDIIFITGDFVEEFNKIEMCISFLKQFKAKYGVWAVLGNWDHWMGQPGKLVKRLKDVGINVLINEHKKLNINSTSLYLVGVDDPFTNRDNLDNALLGIPFFNDKSEKNFIILLAHSPDIFEYAKQANIPLTLVGHTHGGQIRLPIIGPVYALTSTMRKYSIGLFEEGNSQLYVNPGIGWSQINFRLMCPAELTIISLHKSPN